MLALNYATRCVALGLVRIETRESRERRVTALQRIRRTWLRLGLGVILLLGVAAVAMHMVSAEQATDLAKLRTALEIVAILKSEYVEPIDTLDLLGAYIRTGDIDGMLKETLPDDPYTHYMDADAFERTRTNIEGSFAGIGIVVGIVGDYLTIVSPIDDTPGYRAGLRGGDRIVAVDGRSTDALTLNEAVSMMRGPEGTVVHLTIERPTQEGTERFEVEIIRDVVEVKSVSKAFIIEPSEHFPYLADRIAYIRISNFTARTAEELIESLQQAVYEEGAAGVVLDLRDNPGGVLQSALLAANVFIPDGPLLHVVGRNSSTVTYDAHPRYALRNLPPVVVLVNQYSASASEIVSGALQDRGVATLVGETTFGKGLVQTIYPLRSGALSVTTNVYQTAGGRYIHEEGIVPDVTVPWTLEERENATYLEEIGGLSPDDPQLRKALEILQAQVAEAELALAG